MSNWEKECKELNTGLIGLAVTKNISNKTRQRIVNGGDAALRFLVNPLGTVEDWADAPNKNRSRRDIHIHVHQKR